MSSFDVVINHYKGVNVKKTRFLNSQTRKCYSVSCQNKSQGDIFEASSGWILIDYYMVPVHCSNISRLSIMLSFPCMLL